MNRMLMTTAMHLIGNAVGLLVASILLPGFTIKPLAFIIAVVVFTIVEVIALPLFKNLSEKNAPQLLGGISLIVTFFGLWLTELIVGGMTIGGISNWLAATLLVWLGSVIAGLVVPMFLFKELREKKPVQK